MTREEAKQMFRDDKNSQGCYKAVLTKIDKIYDAFEEHINKGQTLPIDSVSNQRELLIDFTVDLFAWEHGDIEEETRIVDDYLNKKSINCC